MSFALPSPPLRPYISTYYLTEIGAKAGPIEDRLHPEWGNVRFSDGISMDAAIGGGPLQPVGGLVVAGPTSKATHFRLGAGRVWGVGLLPLGWARFVGCPADAMADRFVDGQALPAFAAFRGLLDVIDPAAPDARAEAARIDAHMLSLLARPAPNEARIGAVHAGLVDPEITTVGELAERAELSLRALERTSRSAFGFSPKLLLRRQRFLRSLAQFMLDPSLTWLDALDAHYYDQAHFIRDFRRFMGMTPSAYAALPHPLLGAAAKARAAAAGQAVQGLHAPAA